MTPTARALKHLRSLGYTAQVVEQNIRIPGKGMFKRDLFNCIDIVGVRAGLPVLGVQCTSHSNLSARVKKCLENGQAWLSAGAQLECWAFRKLKGHKELQLDRRVIPLVPMTHERSAGMSEEKEVHSDGCTGVQHYTDGVFWTCFCKAVNLNTFAGAWFLHKEGRNGCEACVPTTKAEASHD